MKIKTRFGAALVAVLAAGTFAWGAGNWSTLPVVGGASFCASTVTGITGGGGITGQGAPTTGGTTICQTTVPAGPTDVTGAETVPADLNINGGGPVQTASIPISLLGPINTKINRLVGGDFGTNLWQRGTTPVSASTPTAALMTADRWWVQTATSSGTQVTVSKQTGTTDTIPASGFYASARVARPSAQTGTAPICFGQTMEKQAFAPFLGQNAVFSFYANTGANWSPTNGTLSVSVAAFTAADAAGTQATIGYAGGNSSTFALSAAGQSGGITNYTPEVFAISLGGAGTVASGVASIPTATSSGWVRYAVAAAIPTTLTSNSTAVTGGGVSICWTPVGTAGTNDWIEFTGLQLQLQPSVASQNQPNGVITPSGFERRPAEVEQALQQYYSYVLIESATTIGSRTVCHFTTLNTAMQCPITYPVTMRIAPVAKYTAGFQGFTTTAETTASACTGLATDATVTFVPSVNQTMVQCTLSGTTAAVGLSMTLWDLGTGSATGVMQFSAEP